jgi:hypothetical protein
MGSEDPVELYCSLPLGHGPGREAQVEPVEASSPGEAEGAMRHYPSGTAALTGAYPGHR